MTQTQILQALKQIEAKTALTAEVEYELEDLGLIVTSDQPYAALTDIAEVLMNSQLPSAADIRASFRCSL